MPCAWRRRTGAAFRPGRGAMPQLTRCRSSAICSIHCRGLPRIGCTTDATGSRRADSRHREAAAASRRRRRRRASSRSSPSLSLADELPIPRFFEKEAGRYITAGAIVARDRVSGATNLSIARLMPLEGNRAFVGIAPNHHLAVSGAGGACAGREARYRGHDRQSPGGADGRMPLSRARRGRTADRRRAAGRTAGSGPLHAVGSAGAGPLRMRAGRHARCRRAVHGRSGQRVPRHV